MRFALLLAATLLVGCEAGDPEHTGNTADAASDAPPSCAPEEITPFADDPACMPRSGDYVPGSADDGWPLCISDDNKYHQFSTSISSLTRVAAFDEIGKKLGFGTGKVPSAEDFLAARTVFSSDQGLGSRVERREDEHYPPGPAACNTLTPDQQKLYADRCAGPAKIVPIVNAAFADGSNGKEPRANADRLEAALLWFLYLSPFKEARTCTTTVNDCDSSFAYYTGGDARDAEGKGFARYVKARSAQTHDAIWNGILAVRCWRDLDNPTGAAMDLSLRDKAVGQLDRALSKGLAVIVRQRIARRMCGSSWLGTQILGRVLDREATARDATKAALVRTELAKTDPATVDAKALGEALDALFPCAY
jgi:hypothetical protein